MIHAVRLGKYLLLLGLCTLLLGCSKEAEVATAAVTLTPEPVIISIGVVEKAQAATAEPLVAPTFSPEPSSAPTEDPVDFAKFAPTVNMTYEELVGSTDDMKKKPKELIKGYPDPKTYYIIVDKQWQVTMVFQRLDDGSTFGKPDYDNPVRYMLCSTGNPNKEYGYETMNGTYDIKTPKARFHQFVNLEAAQYLTLIRSLTYFHSILYKTKYDLSSLIKETYDALGSKDSHSCIRLTVPDARWMFYNIAPGTTCEIRDGSMDDTRTQAIRAQLKLPASKSGVKLRASEYTWTDNWQIADVKHDVDYKDQALPTPDTDNAEEIGVTPTPAPDGSTPTTAPATDTSTPATAAPAEVTAAPAADTPAPAADTPVPERNDDIGDVTF